MTEKQTGGPAFPCDRIPMPNGKVLTSDGMTLRDYFAAKAMQGITTDPSLVTYESLANEAYKIADAMLKVRDE